MFFVSTTLVTKLGLLYNKRNCWMVNLTSYWTSAVSSVNKMMIWSTLGYMKFSHGCPTNPPRVTESDEIKMQSNMGFMILQELSYGWCVQTQVFLLSNATNILVFMALKATMSGGQRSVDKAKAFNQSQAILQNLNEGAARTHLSGDNHNYHQAMTHHHSMLVVLFTSTQKKKKAH